MKYDEEEEYTKEAQCAEVVELIISLAAAIDAEAQTPSEEASR